MRNYSFLLFILFSFNSIAQSPYDWCFIENAGQYEDQVSFKHVLPNGSMFLTKTGITYHLLKETNDSDHQSHADIEMQYHAFSVDFLNANNDFTISKETPKNHYFNFFIGENQAKWASEVKGYQSIKYTSIYNKIDFLMYDANNTLKYDFIVKKGGQTSDIKLKYNDLNNLFIDSEGRLHLENTVENIIEDAPYVYQIINSKKTQVSAKYVLNGNVISYEFPNGYNTDYDLIIDPTLIMSTYSGSTELFSANCSAYDAAGNLYVAGGNQFAGFPITGGAYQAAYQGIGADNIAIQKFDAAGTLLFATYFGGAGDYPLDITINNNNELVILGATVGNWPVSVTSAQPIFGGARDYGIGILNNTGTALIGASYMGGSGVEAPGAAVSDNAAGLFIDNATGIILVAGGTESADFPVAPGALQLALNGTSDGVLTAFSADLTTGLWSTYIGGSGDDICNSIAVGQNNNVYAVGNTTSADFPVTAGALNPAAIGLRDGFVIEFSVIGGVLATAAATYLGTAQNDRAKFIKINAANEVFVGGSSNGAYPLSPGVISSSSQNNLYIHKLDAALSTTIFSTAFGCFNTQQPEIFMTAMGIDYCEKIYFTGASTGNNFPVTADAISFTEKGLYMCVLGPDALTLDYGSYFGGNVNGQHFHPGSKSKYNDEGVLFHTECTQANDYTILNGVPSSTLVDFDGASFIFDFEFDMPLVQTAMVTPTGCNFPATLDATDPNNVNVSYLWSTGETTPTIDVNTIGEYKVQIFNACDTIRDSVTIEDLLTQTNMTVPSACEYPITLNASDPNNANVSYLWSTGETTPTIDVVADGEYKVQIYTDCDTIRDSVTVTLAGVIVDFTVSPNQNCRDSIFTFTNISNSVPAGATYSWDFGDGGTSSVENPVYTYTVSDSFDVSLTITTGACENTEIKEKFIFIYPTPIANFEFTPSILTADELTAQFTNTSSSDATIFEWYFASAEISESASENPATIYTDEPGRVSAVNLKVTNIFGCSSEITRYIAVEDVISLYVPNSFTPGSGSNNSLFQPVVASGIDPYNFRLLIYNRWGEIIFESRNYDKHWNGRFDNQIVEQGAYVWQIDFKETSSSKDYTFKGHVTVLR
ncbi:MAG: gliding motility-associated C-terminal domain-containing protein [Crocinitomicaceae bacterium]